MLEIKKQKQISYSKRIAKDESIYSIIIKFKENNNTLLYEEKLDKLCVKPPPSELFYSCFEQLVHCIPLLNKDAEKLVTDFLKVDWNFGEERVIELFRSFTLSLVTSQKDYVYVILSSLYSKLRPDVPENSEALRENPFLLAEGEILAYYNVVQLIADILEKVPMGQKCLVKIASKSFPYILKHVHIHCIYVFNILRLGELIPNNKKNIMEIILMNLVKLDQHTPKEELENESSDDDEGVFHMELDENEQKGATKVIKERSPAQETAHTLDWLMTLMFRYIHFVCHGGSAHKSFDDLLVQHPNSFTVNGCRAGSVTLDDRGLTTGCECNQLKQNKQAIYKLYTLFKDLFTKTLLPTQKCSYVQYLIYYLLSIRPKLLLSDFLDFLRDSFESFSESRYQRRNVLAFLSSILCRANFVSFTHIHSFNELIRNWCFDYLERNRNEVEDIQKHSIFYYACQSLFYVFTFNYKKYSQNKSRLKKALSLQLDQLVMCSLNPLRYCTPKVVDNFSAVAHYYQIAYCQTVIENNRRILIPVASQNAAGNYVVTPSDVEMTFPFDAYMLSRSEMFIENFYIEFLGLPDEIRACSQKEKPVETMEDEDDDVTCRLFGLSSPRRMSFSILDVSPASHR